jgi:simple sugar transport system ATP-binding protein
MSQSPHHEISAAEPALVEVRGLTKRFGDFLANDHIDLDIRQGEIHALLGENGAGKSTLVKMLYGLLQPSEGEIVWRGAPIRMRSPDEARARGVGMVFQHFSLFDNLTVAENIELVSPKNVPRAGLTQAIAEISRKYGVALEPTRPVWTLSAGERQRIEIARCLLQNPKLMILDEPTSVLTPQEAEKLFETLDSLRAEGRALLYISHRLEEVKRMCDRATILRRGKVVGLADPRRESARSLAALMVGQEIKEVRPAETAPQGGRERLVLRDLSLPAADTHGVSLKNVSLAVRGGEVVGVAGVAGEGQSELFEAISGETLVESDETIMIDGLAVGRRGVTERRRLMASFVPEERNGHAAAPDFSLAENVVLSRWATGGLARGGFIQKGAARAASQKIVEAFDVRKSGDDPPARTLSGGNLQKFVVGREILREPGVLVVDQPTWGVDAMAAATIRQALLDLAQRGAAVLVISQDLDELFEISDRIAVIHHGRLSFPVEARAATREEIGLLMGGSHPGSAHHDAASRDAAHAP